MIDLEPETPASVIAGAIILTMVIVLAALIWLCSFAEGGKKDPKTRKPTGEFVIELNEAGEFESWSACKDCGLTHYVHVQLRGPVDKQCAVITYWYDRGETRRLRGKLFSGHDPFDPLGGWAAESDPFK
jgi:hypothetical protein